MLAQQRGYAVILPMRQQTAKNTDPMRRIIPAILTGFLGLSGCSDTISTPDKPAEGSERLNVGGRVEFFSWWTSGGEEEALDALIETHSRRVPNARVSNAAVEFADKARDQLRNRFASGLAPELFQANAGADLVEWIEKNGSNSKDAVIEDLTDMSEALGWSERFHPIMLDSVSNDDGVFAVPVNIHRLNSLFYRKDLFEELNLEPPRTIEELIALCTQIRDDKSLKARAAGEFSCLALGNKWNWTLSSLTFETILPAVAGADFYESYFRGDELSDAPELKKALATSFALYCGGEKSRCLESTFYNKDINEVTWDQGISKLATGAALMAPMGDWAKGYLESKQGGGLVAGVDFDVIPFPDSEKFFVFTGDVVALPRGATNRDGARSFLKTAASAEGQLAFNLLKGSIPARHDVDPKEFDEVQQRTIEDFNSVPSVPALSGTLSGAARDHLHLHLTESFRANTTDIIERYLRANYPLK